MSEEVSTNKLVKECPRCHGFVSFNARTCNCGFNFEPEKLFCEQCGTQLSETKFFCPTCGKAQDKVLCPGCGKVISANGSFCGSCGTPLKNGLETPEEESVKEETNEAKKTINLEELDANFEVDMGRKRVFLSIQLVLICIIALIILFVPIYLDGNFFKDFSLFFKKDFSSCYIRGLDIVKQCLSFLKTKDMNVFASIGNGIKYGNKMVFNLNDVNSGIIISLFYLLSLTSLVFNVIASILGMFIKKVVRSTLILITTIINALFAIFVFVISITNGALENGIDCGINYAFMASFIAYIISMFIFNKEAYLYKSALKI